MTVYVDDLNFKKGRAVWSHMWSADEAELHAMAEKLGLRKGWFQYQNPNFKHYDVTKSKKEEAVKLGAVRVTTRQMVALKNAAMSDPALKVPEVDEETPAGQLQMFIVGRG